MHVPCRVPLNRIQVSTATRPARRRSAFTLVEVLIVIAIIGVLVGLLIPAVNIARRSMQRAAIAFDVETLATAIEQYKNKVGEYPPDGSNGATFARHCRKAFPNIAATELAILSASFGGVGVANSSSAAADAAESVMDPAEALVFFLGGFSNDPVYPFTGPSGPLFLTDSSGVQVKSNSSDIAVVQYNVDRNAPLYEFKQAQLTIDSSSGITISVDESTLFASSDNDCMPVYNSGGGRQAPFVYFDSRTYGFPIGTDRFFNYYNPPAINGVARPYKSAEINTTVSHATAPDAYYRYMNDRGFQLLSAGLDDDYGGIPTSDPFVAPTFFAYPTGQQINIMQPQNNQPPWAGYLEQEDLPSAQLDNAANFSDGIFENALE